MVLTMTLLLCDVGGTFVRFALKRQGTPMTVPQKFRAADYPVFEEAARHFLASSGMPPDGISALGLAFAGRNTWQVTQESVAGLLPRAMFYKINDFEANAYGVLDISEESFLPLNAVSLPKDQSPSKTKCVVGPGTGLGLAYVLEGPQGKMVQKTHGGHMLPAGLGEDSILLFRSLAALRSDGTIPIYEDVVSGRGFTIFIGCLLLRTIWELSIEIPMKCWPKVGMTLWLFKALKSFMNGWGFLFIRPWRLETVMGVFI
jgi:glucokinase